MSQSHSSDRVSLVGWPNGHLHHLSKGQADALIDFKALCATDGCYTEPSSTIRASHDDETLLRFLRARSFSPKDALDQFKATQIWRKDQNIEEWYRTIDINDFEATRVLYTHWTGRRDRNGIPLYVFRIGELDVDLIAKDNSASRQGADGALSPKLRRLFATYEHLTNFVMPLCSTVSSRPYSEVPISQTCCIVDITGVGIRQFWTLKDHLQAASALATAHYPETLGRTYIVGAPGFFPTIWSWIKRWFDPGTVSKIFILSNSEIKSTLEEAIGLEHVPRRYGGNLPWDFGKPPILDDEILRVLGPEYKSTTIPIGSVVWSQSGDKSTCEAHAMGTERGQPRDEIIASIDGSLWHKDIPLPPKV